MSMKRIFITVTNPEFYDALRDEDDGGGCRVTASPTTPAPAQEWSPKRIQRKRTRGFNLRAASSNPNGVIYVGRPTRYGNPYWYVQRSHSGELALALYENTAQGVWLPDLVKHLPDDYVRRIYETHLAWLKRFGGRPREAIRTELADRDLSCWCPLSSPCHVDILLRLANTARGQV